MKKLLAVFAPLLVSVVALPALADSFSWVENNALQSTLNSSVTVTSSSGGDVVTYTYTHQSFTNAGPAVSDAGMYLGWVWAGSKATNNDADWSQYTPMPWDNGTQSFSNANFTAASGPISMTVSATPSLNFLALSTVGDPTGTGPGWTGTPYSYAPGAPVITTDASMNVPFLDFGPMSTNETKFYDISFTFSGADLERQLNDFYVGGQGVGATPLPPVAWGGLMLLGTLGARKTLGRRKAL